MGRTRRQPAREDTYRPLNMASASLPSWLDEETGRADAIENPNEITLDPISIVGDTNAAPVTELAPVEIRGRAPDDDSWVPDFVMDAVGRVVEDERTGLAGYEIPEWVARVIANDDGTMPTGALEALGNIIDAESVLTAGPNPVLATAGGMARNLRRDVDVPASERTVLAAPALAGASQALSFGLADDIVGALPDSVTRAAGVGATSSDDLLRQMRGDVRWSEREAPGSYRAGELAALAGQMAVPGAPVARAASPAIRGLAAGAEGAVYGGLEGFGRSDADTLDGRLRDAAPSAALGGVLGGGVGYVGGRTQRAADAPVDEHALRRLEDDATWERLSQAGGAQSLSSRRQRILAPGTTEAERTQSARRMVERLWSEGAFDSPYGRLLPPPSVVIQGRVADRMGPASDVIGETTQRMANERVDPGPLIRHAEERLAQLEQIPGAEAQANAMRRYLEQFRARADAGDLTFSDLQTWKTFWRQNTNFDAPLQVDRHGIYRAIGDTMQEGVERVDPQLGADYRDAREMYSIGKRFEEMAGDESRNAARTRTFGLGDYLTGLEGFREGGVLGGIASIIANKGLRGNEHAFNAARLERAAERLRTSPERFGRWAGRLQAAQQRGPRALAAALYLAGQNDPEIRAVLQEPSDARETKVTAQESAPLEYRDEMTLDDLVDDSAPIEYRDDLTMEDLIR